MKKIVLILLIVIASVTKQSLAENKHKMDSLKMELKNAKSDTNKLRTYLNLLIECDIENNLYYAELGIKAADEILANSNNKELRKAVNKFKSQFYGLKIPYYELKLGVSSPKILETYEIQYKLFSECEYKIGIRNVITNKADYYITIGENFKGLNLLKEGLNYAKSNDDKLGMSSFYNKLSYLFSEVGDTLMAVSYREKAIGIIAELGDTNKIDRGLLISADFYSRIRQYPIAINYCYKAVKRFNYLNDKAEVAHSYHTLGEIYQEMGNIKKAIYYFDLARKIGQEIKGREKDIVIHGSLFSLGKIYLSQKKYDLAIEYHKKCLLITEKYPREDVIATSNTRLAEDYFVSKNYREAKRFIVNALPPTIKSGIPTRIMKIELLCSKIDSGLGDFKSAYLHHLKYIEQKSKVNNEDVLKNGRKEKFQADLDKQKAVDKAKSDEEISKQKILRNSFISGFALMFLLAGVSYRNFRRKKKDNQIITLQKTEVEKQKHLVEQKNTEILDSIEYAKRIQNTILPPQKIVSQYLENSFILYLPKDIVAGDFYWMNSPKLEENENSGAILFAACDCTGHGVPGAMVSVVCSNALNKAVKEFGLTEPAKILDKVAELVIEDLSKNNEVGDEIQDGMDASLASLNTSTGEMQWAGANNALYIVPSSLRGSAELEQNEITTKQSQNSEEIASGFVNLRNDELTEVRPDKQPIGKFDNPKPFTNHTIQLQKGDTIYLFTDGYADQFGGPKGKKYSKGKFKELLLSIQHLPMNEQREALYNAHLNWRRDLEQVDDICVIGVRV